MPTAAVSGRIVLDPDDGETGAATLARLQDDLGDLGDLGETLTVRTPGPFAQLLDLVRAPPR